MTAIGRFWTGEWLDLRFNMVSPVAVYSKGAGAGQGREVIAGQETIAMIQAKGDCGSD